MVQEAANYAAGHATGDRGRRTDTSGSAKYNVRLSERRAKAAADALVGAAQTARRSTGRVKLPPAVATGDGVKEPLNRLTIDINFDLDSRRFGQEVRSLRPKPGPSAPLASAARSSH